MTSSRESQMLPQPLTLLSSAVTARGHGQGGCWRRAQVRVTHPGSAVPSPLHFPCSWRTRFSSHRKKHSMNHRCLGCIWVTQFSARIKTDVSESPGNRVTHRTRFLCFLYPEKKKKFFEIVENDGRREKTSTVPGQSPQRL